MSTELSPQQERTFQRAARQRVWSSQLDEILVPSQQTASVDCAICLEPIVSHDVALPCKHRFHKPCAKRWLLLKPSCPLCNGEVTPQLPE